MTTPDGESFYLRVGVDVEPIDIFLGALGEIPEAMQAVAAEVARVAIGDPKLFEQQGARLGRALIEGFQAQLAGFDLNLVAHIQRTLGGLPPGLSAGGLNTEFHRALEQARPALEQPLFTPATFAGLREGRADVEALNRNMALLTAQAQAAERSLHQIASLSLPSRLLERTLVDGRAQLQLTREASEAARLLNVNLPSSYPAGPSGRSYYNPRVVESLRQQGIDATDPAQVNRSFYRNPALAGAPAIEREVRDALVRGQEVGYQRIYRALEQFDVLTRGFASLQRLGLPAGTGAAPVDDGLRRAEERFEARLQRVGEALERHFGTLTRPAQAHFEATPTGYRFAGLQLAGAGYARPTPINLGALTREQLAELGGYLRGLPAAEAEPYTGRRMEPGGTRKLYLPPTAYYAQGRSPDPNMDRYYRMVERGNSRNYAGERDRSALQAELAYDRLSLLDKVEQEERFRAAREETARRQPEFAAARARQELLADARATRLRLQQAGFTEGRILRRGPAAGPIDYTGAYDFLYGGPAPTFAGPRPPALPRVIDEEAATRRREANAARLRAAGIDPEAFAARGEAISQVVPPPLQRVGAAADQAAEAERRLAGAAHEAAAALRQVVGPGGRLHERDQDYIDRALAGRGGPPFVAGAGGIQRQLPSANLPVRRPPGFVAVYDPTLGRITYVPAAAAGGAGAPPPPPLNRAFAAGDETPPPRRQRLYNTGFADLSGEEFSDEENERMAERARARRRQAEQDRINRLERERQEREFNYQRYGDYSTHSERRTDRTSRAREFRDRIIDPDQTPGFLNAVGQSLRGPDGRFDRSGFQRSFREGFFGNSGDIVSQLGQTAKFSILYGTAYKALFAFTQGFDAAIQGAIQFEDALAALNTVTERGGRENEAFASSLSHIATAAGAQGAAGIAAGAQAIGLYGLADAPRAQQEAIARESVRVASRLSYVTGTPLDQTQVQLAGAGRSFGVGPSDQRRIADLATYTARQTGGTATAVLDALAQVGTLAQTAGFSIEQTAAIIARLTTTTAQTPQAVAGFLSQILSRADDPNILNSLAGLGVNTNGTTLAQQIGQLANLNLPTGSRNQVVQQFGRGRSGQALSIILDQYGSIQEQASRSQGAAEGSLEREFGNLIGTVGGQLRKLGADFRQLAVDVAETGIFDVLALLIKALDATVRVVDQVVQAFNSIPRELRSILAIAAEFYYVGRLLLGLRALAGLGGAAQASTGLLAAGRNLSTRVGASYGEALAGGASRAGAAVAAGATALGSLVNPATLAVAGLLAIAQTKGAFDRLNEAASASAAALGAGGEARTSDEYGEAASAAELAAKGERKSRGGFFSGFVNVIQGGAAHRLSREREARDRDAVRFYREREAAIAFEAGGGETPFGVGGGDITGGLRTLANNGVSAAEQLRQVSAALGLLGGTARQVATGLRFNATGRAALGADLDYAARKALNPRNEKSVEGVFYNEIVGPDGKKRNIRYDEYGPRAVDDALQTAATDLGITPGALLDEETARELANRAADNLIEALGISGSEEDIEAVRQNLRVALAGRLAQEDFGGIRQRSLLNDAQITALLQGSIGQLIGNVRSQISPLSLGGGEDQLKQVRDTLLALQGQSVNGTGPDALVQAIADAEAAYSEAAVRNLERRRAALQSKAGGDSALISRIGRQYLNAEAQLAAQSGNEALLFEVLSRATSIQIKYVQQAVDRAYNVAKAAYGEDTKVTTLASGLASRVAHAEEGDLSPGDAARITDAARKASSGLDKAKKAKETVDKVVKDVVPADVSGFEPDQGAIEAARRLSQVAAGSGLGTARATLENARDALKRAKEGSVEFYNALREVNEAKEALAQQERDYSRQAALNSIDITDPVAVARVELNIARRKLEEDRARGAGKDTLATDVGEVRQRQNELERAQFDQNLQAAQTNYRLGRMSGEAYLRYLQSQHDYLSAIRNKTYQQQQELNEVDGLLKEITDQLQGQFNIGDIRIPTPYEVRRSIEAKAAGLAATGGSSTQVITTNLYINGADVGMVKQTINEALGTTAMARAGVTGRKVGGR